MNRLSKELGQLALLLVSAVLVGWVFGVIGWALFVAALAYIVVQHREFQELARWAQRPLARPRNRREAWQNVSNGLFRALMRARGRTRAAFKQLHALRTLSDVLPDAAIVIDTAGHIEQHNQAAMALLHLTRSDRGANLASLVRQPDFVALNRGRVAEELIEFASPYSEGLRLEARRVPLSDGRALILVRDVTQLNRLLSMRQDFIANVSHELRTPLTVIVGYLETLLNEDLDLETTRKLVAKLASPSARMQALVDDLLLLTRLEASPSPTEEELTAVDMATLIDTVVADARGLSNSRHRFGIHVDSRAKIHGIETELHSACSNLISNAVRYSPDGGTIDVSWRPVDGNVRFSVSDQGIGIPPEHLTRITERFYRVDLANARIRGGTGLGLAIVKHVLKRHNATLQVESTLGKGSTFFFDISEHQLAETKSSGSATTAGR